eukprot:g4527.t1
MPRSTSIAEGLLDSKTSSTESLGAADSSKMNGDKMDSGRPATHRLKAKLKSRRIENKKQAKSISSLSGKLAAVKQQCIDFEQQLKATVSSNNDEMRLLQDRVEASERHYGEKLGYARRNLEGERAETEKLKLALSRAGEAAAFYKRKLEHVQIEVNSVKSVSQASLDKEKADKQRMRRLWVDTVEKLEKENADLWQQLHFLEVALLEEDLLRSGGSELVSGAATLINTRLNASSPQDLHSVTSRNAKEAPRLGSGKRQVASQKDTRKARHRLQKQIHLQEEASRLASKVRALEMKVYEGRQEQAVTAGRLDFAERRVRELLSEIRRYDIGKSDSSDRSGINGKIANPEKGIASIDLSPNGKKQRTIFRSAARKKNASGLDRKGSPSKSTGKLYGKAGIPIQGSDETLFIDALIRRLVLSSVNGKRRLQLGKDRTVAVSGSDPEEEMARLMGTGTQKEELDRIKRDIKQGLEEVNGEVMDPNLVKAAIFTEVKRFDTPHGKQLLTVRLLDEFGTDQNGGSLVVYCSNQQDGRIRYRLVISRADINNLVPGGVTEQGSRRRLCRMILSQLAIKGGYMTLCPPVADPDVDQNSLSHSDSADEAPLDDTTTDMTVDKHLLHNGGELDYEDDFDEINDEFYSESSPGSLNTDTVIDSQEFVENTSKDVGEHAQAATKSTLEDDEDYSEEDFDGDSEDAAEVDTVVCASCGNDLDPNSAFCLECGAKRGERSPAVAPESQAVDNDNFGETDSETESEPGSEDDLEGDTFSCASCGSDLHPGVAFCTECGAKVDNNASAQRETTSGVNETQRGSPSAIVSETKDRSTDSNSSSDDASGDFGWL